MTDSQKAYYYLLLTQARYKNDVVATQDDEINFSVRYYADSKDENKYMRSLLYQGAVSEELGHLDKAVDCYHQVECMAANLDSFHLAYSKMRMAFLYLSYPIGANTIALNKFVEAERIYNQELPSYPLINPLSFAAYRAAKLTPEFTQGGIAMGVPLPLNKMQLFLDE